MNPIIKNNNLAQNKSTRAALILILIVSMFFLIGFKSNFKRNFSEANNSFYLKNSGPNSDKNIKTISSLLKNNKSTNQTHRTFLTKRINQSNKKNNIINKAIDNITLKGVVCENVPPLADGMVVVTPNFEAYKIIIPIKTEAQTISIPYDQSLIPVGYLESDIRTYRFDESVKKWEELQKEGIDPEKNLIYSRTHVDGLMINGIIKSPELPQTDNYIPTRIKDLKLADPGYNVQLIEPPVANQQGSARLSYNIQIPKGRNGIEPDLKITYNSDGSNGLLGEGWNLHIPTISIETRWGVPIYDPINESETYLLDGEMLAFENDNGTALAHRNLGIKRNTSGDRQFFKRKQTDYYTTIRHGNKPTEYWWEIIDNKGTKFYYGRGKQKYNDVNLQDINDSKLTDQNKNIAEWKLTRVIDVFGNCMEFHYSKEKASLNTLGIENSYINFIEYSGYDVQSPLNDYNYNYKVHFVWKDNNHFNYSARYGFLTGNIKLLESIYIDLNIPNDNDLTGFTKNGKRVRSYKFDYKDDNSFGKPLLIKLTQFGTDGTTEFNHHTFEYYDDVKEKGLFSPGTWTSQNESLQDEVIPNGIIPNTEPTDLGGSKSSGSSLSFYAGVGINDWQICNKNLTVGVQFGFNSSHSEGLNTLIDIDGDGLPDKVFIKEDKLLYNKNMGTGFSGQSHAIAGRSQFFEESSSTNSFGVSSYFGLAISRDKSSTETDITTYFSDVNADGLVDIVADGHVYFNHIDANDIPSFSESSSGTSQPITGGTINVTDNTDYAAKSKERANDNPQHDVVRVWEAPFNGTININAPVQLLPPSLTTDKDRRKFDEKADGVIITVQNGGIELERIIIFKDDYTIHPINKSDITVKAGDKIYFRLMSGNAHLSNADFDKVNWIPEIVYTSENGNQVNAIKNCYDVFGENLYEYNIGSDFLFTNEAGIYLDTIRTVKIAMPFKKQITSNDIRIQIVQLSENLSDPIIRNGVQVEEDGKKLFNFTNKTVLFDKLLGKEIISTSICDENLIELTLSKESIYQFKILSDVNTDFKKVSWEPYIFFFNQNRKENDTIFVIPNYQIRNELNQRSELYPYPESSTSPTDNPPFIVSNIYPYLKFKTASSANDSIWFTIRKGREIVAKYNLKYDKGKLTNYTGDVDQFELNKGEELYATFESDEAFKNNGKIEGANWVIGKYSLFDGKIDNVGSNFNSFISRHEGSYILTHNIAFKTVQTQSVKYSILRNGITIKKGSIEFNQQQEQKELLRDTIQLNVSDIITVNYENIKPPITIPATPPRSIVETTEIDVSLILLADLWYKKTDEKFGPMYRNWGQFVYNDKKDGSSKVIDETVLEKQNISVLRSVEIRNNINNQLNSASTNALDISGLSELNKKNAKFNTLVPFRTLNEYQWKGMDDNIFINQALQSSSRVGLKDVNVKSPFKTFTVDDGTANGIIKRSSSWSNSHNKSVIVAGINKADGGVNTESDYIDLNGDRFPDILSGSKAQLTNPSGSLRQDASSLFSTGFKHSSSNSSNGNHIGGSSAPSFSGNTANNQRSSPSSSVNLLQISKGSVAAEVLSALSIGSYSKTEGRDFSELTFLDINGDGLPDKLYKDGSFLLNMGQGFNPVKVYQSGLTFAPNGNNISGALSLGYNNGNGSISGGLGVSVSRSLPEQMLLDINGDGVIDKIEINGDAVSFSINNGLGFELAKTINLLNQSGNSLYGDKWRTSFNASAGNSFGGNFTYGFVFPPFPYPIFKFSLSPGIYANRGLGTTLRQFYDINGDGYPDYLFSEKEGNLHVQLSNIGRTNKLKSVLKPLGGSFEIDYVHNEATYDHPNGKWVMNILTIKDGVSEDRLVDNGFDSKQSFQYKKGKYDRYEREFLGFGEIITNDLDFDGKPLRKHIQIFDNKNYYTANNLITDRIEDPNGNKYVETVNEFWHYPNAIGDKEKQGEDNPDIQEFDSRVYSFPLKYSSNNAYEGQSQKIILNESYYAYDELGNNTLFRYSNKSNLFSSNFKIYDYETVKKYEPIKPSKIFGLLINYLVHNTNVIFREGGAEYNSNGTLKSESVNLNSLQVAKTQYEYDKFGNIIKKILPDGFWIQFEYEPALKVYLQKIINQRNNFSRNDDYDYRFGFARLLSDLNGNITKYKLDPILGRIIKVWSAMEYKDVSESEYNTLLPTIEIFYDSDLSKTAHSKVVHKTILDAKEEIITHTYIDGNKRIVQTKKNALISNNQGNEDRGNKWSASGKIIYDAIGRIAKQYYPCKDNKEGYDNSLIPSVSASTEFNYDILDRKISTKLPLSKKLFTLVKYGINYNMLYKSETVYNENSSLNKITTEYYNGSGDKIKIELKHDSVKPYTTTFEYDAIHQLSFVKDNKGNPSAYSYDYKGRLIKQSSSDGGDKEFNYDLLDNKTNEILPNGKFINYKYDHERLIEVTYSDNPQNRIQYVYGNENDGNRNGRLYFKEDATGAEEYSYDKVGNIVQIIKTIVAPFDKDYTFETKFKYDSWNRIRNITYPDGDLVEYKYNSAGLLDQITSDKGKDYVKNIGYDEFEQKVFIKYGNGVTTSYAYDDRRRLNSLTLDFTDGKSSQSTYKYDNQNNISFYGNHSNIWNGDVSYNYNYNDLLQLIGSNGSIGEKKYQVSYEYDDRFNIIENNNSLISNTPKLLRTYNLKYSVNQNSNHIDKITETTSRTTSNTELDKHYSENNELSNNFDERGNNIQQSKTDLLTKRIGINKREIIYDEENRLSAINLNGFVSNYFYSDKGDRIIKLSTQTDNIYVNGLLSAEKINSTSFSLYVSPYFSTRNGRNLYTKHIYIGNERIVSELVNNNNPNAANCDNTLSSNCNAIAQINYSTKKDLLDKYINDVYDKFDLHHKQIQSNAFVIPLPLSYVSERNPSATQIPKPIDIQVGLRYFYHTNQINSVNYISDASGQVVQQIEYLPYGQVFLEQRKGYSSQFTFTDKEEDHESGLIYFGARYYDSKVALWQSVDPMADKYPGLSPYNYCLANPIKMVDPDGNSPEENWNRAFGVLKLAGGVSEAAVGATAGVATSWTGVGGVLGALAFAHGADNSATGFKQILSGKIESSMTVNSLNSLGFSSQSENIDLAISLVSTAGLSNLSISSDKLVRVTSWSTSTNTDLASGRWVMLGGPTKSNYYATGLTGGKYEFTKSYPFINKLDTPVAPFTNFKSDFVPQSSLKWPSGWEAIKGVLGQRIID